MPVDLARSRSLASRPVPKRLGWRVSDQPGDHGTLHQQPRRHQHPSEASPRASNDRVESTGKKPPRSPSWADLDHNLYLDRLPLNQARPGQSHLGGPTYLARDNQASRTCENDLNVIGHLRRAVLAAYGEWFRMLLL